MAATTQANVLPVALDLSLLELTTLPTAGGLARDRAFARSSTGHPRRERP
jgi:hypothetical protein